MKKATSPPLFTVYSGAPICCYRALRYLKSLGTLHTLTKLLIITVIMAACRNQNVTSSLVPADVTFLKQKQTEGERAVMDALLTGDLVEVNGCLRVNDTEAGNSYLLIWLPDFRRATEYGKTQVRDGSGQIIVQVGDKVRISGGAVPFEFVGEFSIQTPPFECPGPYWIVGDEVRRSEN